MTKAPALRSGDDDSFRGLAVVLYAWKITTEWKIQLK